jgi:Asp-tRNA(Asn)/Glu-tRNA(Gln) amidotransferase A subunit family amidase
MRVTGVICQSGEQACNRLRTVLIDGALRRYCSADMLTVSRALADADAVDESLSRRRDVRDGGAYVITLDAAPGAGPLANVPIAIKDLVDVAGTRTRCGSGVRAHAAPASRDAAIVARLRAAGARIVGKTALVEFAFGATGINEWEGTPRNPHDRARIPGGSSSGSAVAVAEGSAAAAIGTDTGGSVRIPAALCGVVGMKPTFGLVSVDGVFPLAPALDHVGVLAPDVASARAVLEVLAPLDASLPPRRVGIDRRALAESTPEVARAIEAALARWRVTQRDVALPDLDDVAAMTTTLLFYEAAQIHRATYARCRDDYGAYMRDRLERAFAYTAAEYAAARERAREMRDQVERAFGDVDVIAGPAVGFTAPTLEEARAPDASTRLVRFTRLWNAVGFPAISVPVPATGLPVGVQLAARADGAVLAAAASFERAVATA